MAYERPAVQEMYDKYKKLNNKELLEKKDDLEHQYCFYANADRNWVRETEDREFNYDCIKACERVMKERKELKE